MHGPNAARGREASAALTSLLIARDLYLVSHRDEQNRERYLCKVMIEPSPGAELIDVADEMRRQGYQVDQGQ